jgi:hypothetical protein
MGNAQSTRTRESAVLGLSGKDLFAQAAVEVGMSTDDDDPFMPLSIKGADGGSFSVTVLRAGLVCEVYSAIGKSRGVSVIGFRLFAAGREDALDENLRLDALGITPGGTLFMLPTPWDPGEPTAPKVGVLCFKQNRFPYRWAACRFTLTDDALQWAPARGSLHKYIAGRTIPLGGTGMPLVGRGPCKTVCAAGGGRSWQPQHCFTIKSTPAGPFSPYTDLLLRAASAAERAEWITALGWRLEKAAAAAALRRAEQHERDQCIAAEAARKVGTPVQLHASQAIGGAVVLTWQAPPPPRTAEPAVAGRPREVVRYELALEVSGCAGQARGAVSRSTFRAVHRRFTLQGPQPGSHWVVSVRMYSGRWGGWGGWSEPLSWDVPMPPAFSSGPPREAAWKSRLHEAAADDELMGWLYSDAVAALPLAGSDLAQALR